MNDRKCEEVLNEIMRISHYVPNEDFTPIQKLKDNISNNSVNIVYMIQHK